MPDLRDATQLAAISGMLTGLREEQRTMLAVLTKLVETAGAQTEILADILEAARQEQGPSEAAEQLAALTVAIQQNSDAVAGIGEQLATLPAEIGAELARALPEGSPKRGEPC